MTTISVLCVCAVLGFLKLMTTLELEERIEKIEALLEQWGKHDAATGESIMKLLEPTARQ
jgi:hypothetical protein